MQEIVNKTISNFLSVLVTGARIIMCNNRGKITRFPYLKQVRFCQILQNSCLDYYFFLLVDLPELARGHPALGLEDAVEIGQVVESALVADLGDVLRGVHQLAGRVPEPDVDQVAGQRAVGVLPEEAAEGAGLL